MVTVSKNINIDPNFIIYPYQFILYNITIMPQMAIPPCSSKTKSSRQINIINISFACYQYFLCCLKRCGNPLQFMLKSHIIRLGNFITNQKTREYERTGGEILKAVDIALTHHEQISQLVNITNRYPYTILLRQGRYLVDAKSVLGVLSLQRNLPLQLEIYSDDCHALLKDLEPMIC